MLPCLSSGGREGGSKCLGECLGECLGAVLVREQMLCKRELWTRLENSDLPFMLIHVSFYSLREVALQLLIEAGHKPTTCWHSWQMSPQRALSFIFRLSRIYACEIIRQSGINLSVSVWLTNRLIMRLWACFILLGLFYCWAFEWKDDFALGPILAHTVCSLLFKSKSLWLGE